VVEQTADCTVEVQDIGHNYGETLALDGLSFRVPQGEIFGLLGPNGGGKTTLFRILSTIFKPSRGQARVCGFDVLKEPAKVREKIGVVFQSPSLDKKLKVHENLKHQGHLYGLSGADLKARIDRLLDRVGLTDRRNDRVETLSGGLQRRVEVAKGLLHDPKVLILDEPSTGLDPGARLDLWTYLRGLARDEDMTILVTTHLMEEAERCDRLLILNKGKCVALGAPDELRREIGGSVVTFQTSDGQDLEAFLKKELGASQEIRVFERTVRLESEDGYELAAKVSKDFSGTIDAVTVGRPTLEDVFIKKTGHQFWNERQS
jgi:ABC-2 type transport system ATP-binding protein